MLITFQTSHRNTLLLSLERPIPLVSQRNRVDERDKKEHGSKDDTQRRIACTLVVVSFAFVSLSAMINVSYFSMYVYMYNILVLFLSLY